MSGHQPPSNDLVQAELARILSSRGFANAGRLSRLLRHVVEKTLAGETDQLKEYSVGMEVFDRDDTYDPRIDSIVRVEAGRLRSRLEEYYAAAGAGAAVRISLPRGAYVARFEPNGSGPVVAEAAAIVQPRPQRGRAGWALGAVLAAVVAAAVVWLGGSSSTQGPPSVAVLAFEQYSVSQEDGAIARQLTDTVTAELARLGTVGVVSHTSAMQFAGERKPLRDIAAALNAGFLVEGAVENVDGGVRVTARIVNAATDRKMWVQDFAGRSDDIRALSKSIADGVSQALLSATARSAP